MDDKFNRLFQLIRSPHEAVQLIDSIVKAVARSIKLRPMATRSIVTLSVSHDEEKHRVEWCVDWALEMIRDRGWAIERTADKVGRALLDKLDSKIVAPSELGMWSV